MCDTVGLGGWTLHHSVFQWQDPETSHILPDKGNVQNYSRSKRWEQRGLIRHRGLEQG